MNSDPGELVASGPRSDHTLPEVTALKTRLTSFEPPRRTIESALPAVSDAVEFLVETATPIPIRALGPVLLVGDTLVMEMRADDPTHYRFTALRPGELRSGAPISLGWLGDRPDEGKSTRFSYEPPTE